MLKVDNQLANTTEPWGLAPLRDWPILNIVSSVICFVWFAIMEKEGTKVAAQCWLVWLILAKKKMMVIHYPGEEKKAIVYFVVS